MHNALILHYHETVAENNVEAGKHRFCVTPEDLAAQLACIQKLKMPVVSLEELVENDYQRKRWHRHVLLLSCTDTFLAGNPGVLPLLQQVGFPLTVFITTGINPDPERREFWRTLASAGFSLGSHSVSQACLPQIPEEEMHRELADSKAMIEAETGKPVRFLDPPFGAYDRKTVVAAQELGYEALLTNKVGVNKFNANLFGLKRWTVPGNTSLSEFESMLRRDKTEMIAQKVKSRALQAGKLLWKQGLLKKLKRLFF